MPRVYALSCLIFAFTVVSLAAQSLPLFPSRTAAVYLQSTDGQEITAVIHDVSPEQQSARIFVEEQREVFAVPLDLFDEKSQAILQDWFYKRLINERLSIKNEEDAAAGMEFDPAMNVDNSNQHIGSRTNARRRKIISTLYNSSPYEINDLHIVYGVQVSRSFSDSGLSRKPGDSDRLYNSEHRVKSIKPRAEAKIESMPVRLTSRSSTYTKTVNVFVAGMGTVQQERRHTRREADRISASYTLVYYKDELVAAITTRNSLVDERLQYRKKPQPKSFSTVARGRPNLEEFRTRPTPPPREDGETNPPEAPEDGTNQFPDRTGPRDRP